MQRYAWPRSARSAAPCATPMHRPRHYPGIFMLPAAIRQNLGIELSFFRAGTEKTFRKFRSAVYNITIRGKRGATDGEEGRHASGLRERERGRVRKGPAVCATGCTQQAGDLEQMPRLFNSLHQDNLPVQPVAHRPGNRGLPIAPVPARDGSSFKSKLGVLLESELENPLMKRSRYET